ncbi:hypothetical protein [Xylophilus sp. GOD-11R]|uniref:hypothetical protein n=1 Tax=Xylophilus sp. GOD-11R TaxID=3089814 RepID=UPI00298D4F13|nr:hypothetical protein [Xylophilus sp. GOD-11R]WPB55691.1 hypothetical protein R9X41_16290 [Xylophilus sp. GOD-11R]
MSTNQITFDTIAAHQDRLFHLEAGTELRATEGRLTVFLPETGLTQVLAAGQAMRIADTQAVLLRSSGAARFSLQTEFPRFAQTKKNRQGLAGLWRFLAERLNIRREPRAV